MYEAANVALVVMLVVFWGRVTIVRPW
jgi:hypothetical protein